MSVLLQGSVVSTTPWAELPTSPKLSHEDDFGEGEKQVFTRLKAQIQVKNNCWYSVAQMCNWEDTHARLFTRAVLDDVMSQNELTTIRMLN